MANSWLRLWHDMPNDPKWRTIARVSKQPISAVIAVYVHILVIASNAIERGRTQNVCSEDLASALDLEVDQIEAILEAMQGRVLDGDMVSGWKKRQVEREDGSAERAKAWRLAQKEAKQTEANATERKQTPDKDTDKDKEVINTPIPKKRTSKPKATTLPEDFSISERVVNWAKEKGHTALDTHLEYFISVCRAKGYAYVDWDDAFMTAIRANWAKVQTGQPSAKSWRDNPEFQP
jgi:hypothetical protein